MVNPRERLHHYRSKGLEAEQGFEQPGVEYPRHSHEQTTLYTVSGKLILTLYDSVPPTVVELRPGSEYVIGERVEHSAVVGETGWGYVAAWDPEKAKEFADTH